LITLILGSVLASGIVSLILWLIVKQYEPLPETIFSLAAMIMVFQALREKNWVLAAVAAMILLITAAIYYEGVLIYILIEAFLAAIVSLWLWRH